MTEAPADITAALHTVLDPCSIAAGSPLSIVDMGMVVDTRQDADGAAHVTMRLTSPMCLLGALIARDAEEAIATVPGVTRVQVDIDPDPVWSPDQMTGAGKRSLEERRASRPVALPQPQQWKRQTTGPGSS